MLLTESEIENWMDYNSACHGHASNLLKDHGHSEKSS
jgi:hypothetical protein